MRSPAESTYRTVPNIMAQTGLLPCLLWEGTRWWLPLCSATANLLGQILLEVREHTEPTDRLLEGLTRQLRRDCAFRIWAAIEADGEVHNLASLASVCLNKLPMAFDGSRSLFAPEYSPSWQARWRQLQANRWSTSLVTEWLEVTGPDVPEAWRSQWPRVLEESSPEPVECLDHGDNQLDLVMVARIADHSFRMRQAFADAVEREKLAAMKQLAYGLSHEINNPLANISTRAETLMRDEPSADRLKFLAAIVSQSTRAYEMLADLMFVAHPASPNKERIDVKTILEQVIGEFMESWHDRGIACTHGLEQGWIEGDCSQVTDMMRALLRNATEAIFAGGTIRIESTRTSNHVDVRVYDSGSGLSDLDRRHAFDPYFSGREAGRGLGLGLPKARRIAELHGGTISLEGGPIGTIARVRFPSART